MDVTDQLDALSDRSAEIAVLSHFLAHPDRISDMGLKEEDFTLTQNSTLFRNIWNMAEAGTPIDRVTVTSRLRGTGGLDTVGGESYIDALLSASERFSNIDQYVAVVKDLSTRRNLVATMRMAETSLLDTAVKPEETLSLLGQEMARHEFRRRGGGFRPIDETLDEIMADLDRYAKGGNAITGVPTGWLDLDRFTSGLQQDDLFIVGGRPSMGKSSFLLQLLASVALTGRPAAFFSVEMGVKSLLQRLVSLISGVELERVRGIRPMYANDWQLVIDSCEKIQSMPLFVDDTPGIDHLYMEREFKNLLKTVSVAVCGIDYIQLINGPRGDGRVLEVQAVTQRAKDMAREHKIPFVALAQLSRANEKREDKRPMMSDLRDSGGIEQIADLIAFIHREVVYNKEAERPNIAEFIVTKNRNGSTGTINFFFDAARTRFLDLAVRQEA
jgi:replicative DNA helicase